MTESPVVVAVSRRCSAPALLTETAIRAAVRQVWTNENGPAGARVEVVLMDEAEHSALHGEFLNDPSPTDVMAFPYEDEDCFGEILINVEMAARVAAAHGQTPEQECRLYLVHGCLHLLGYDDHDEEDRRAMRAAEARAMNCPDS